MGVSIKTDVLTCPKKISVPVGGNTRRACRSTGATIYLLGTTHGCDSATIFFVFASGAPFPYVSAGQVIISLCSRTDV